MSWTWGLGEELVERLRRAEVRSRGAKTLGALVSEDIDVAWRAASETLEETLAALLASGVAGRRIAVQEHGGDLRWFVDGLEGSGRRGHPGPDLPGAADRIGPSGRTTRRAWLPVASSTPITCTSVAAVQAIAAVDGLVEDLHRTAVTCACVGSVTAAAARAANLPDIVTADPHRLGSMVRALGTHLAARGTSLEVAGSTLRHQGARLSVDGTEARLTPRERRLLEVLLSTDGVVLSKERLAAIAWDAPVDEHTVEVAVNRLRRKLGPAAAGDRDHQPAWVPHRRLMLADPHSPRKAPERESSWVVHRAATTGQRPWGEVCR